MKLCKLLLSVSLLLAALMAVRDARAGEICSQTHLQDKLIKSYSCEQPGDKATLQALQGLRAEMSKCEDAVDSSKDRMKLRSEFRTCVERTSESLGALRYVLGPNQSVSADHLDRGTNEALTGLYEKFRNKL